MNASHLCNKLVSDLREQRLERVKEQITTQPSDVLVHFEMASYVDLTLLNHLTRLVLPFADSVGMNEQELSNLLNVLEHGQVSVVADSNPRIATALDQMRKIFLLIRDRNEREGSPRKLSRIHVHTLAYQAILTTRSKWKRTEAAAAKAALTAHRYVCNNDNIALDKSKLLLDDSFATTTEESSNNNKRVFFEPNKPVSCWEENLGGESVDLCVAPVLICTEAQLTAGAGDNISAAGLVLQVERSI